MTAQSATPVGSTRRLKVFLCHASGDKPAVRDLYDRLRTEGFDPWLDEEKLLPGQDWQLEIPQEVRSSDAVIVCLSSRAVTKRGYVQKEIRHALDVADEQPEGAIFLIPLRLEECEVPVRLRRWQWVDSFQEEGYERLLRALRARAESLGLGMHPWEPENERDSAGPQAEPSTQKVSFQVWNGQYLCAVDGGGGVVLANGSETDECAIFELIELGNNRIALRAQNGDYLCAERGGGREVVANRSELSRWETFQLIELEGDEVALRTSTGQYVCAVNGGGREVVASSNKRGERETFKLIRHNREVQMRTPQYSLDLSYDGSVFGEIRKALPTEGKVIYRACNEDFFGSFDTDWIYALEQGLDHCRFEFADDELEALRRTFVNATERFLERIKLDTFPLDRHPGLSCMKEEWEFSDSEDYFRVGRELNTLAQEVCEAHKCLIHIGRRKLGM